MTLSLRWIDPPGSAFIFSYNIQNDIPAKQQWTNIEKISPWLQVSVIASEDQKFPQHFGFDIESIKSSLNENRNRPRGASTISQQVAKNLFLWNGRSYIRKAIEAWLTVLIECFWSKRRILETYLNVAEFGPGIYGAEAAANAFFDKPALNLNWREAGTLAAVLPNPKRMSAQRPSRYVQSRTYTIYTMVKKLGGIQFLERLDNN